MSYRNIEVNGKKYEYVIGSTHVKIKGVGLWPKGEVGNEMRGINDYDGEETVTVEVTPANIKRLIAK